MENTTKTTTTSDENVPFFQIKTKKIPQSTLPPLNFKSMYYIVFVPSGRLMTAWKSPQRIKLFLKPGLMPSSLSASLS